MNKLLVFKADWCEPCRHMTPILKELDQSRIEYYDFDSDRDKAREYSVPGIPCFILVDEELNEVDCILGATTKERLEELLNE